MSVLGGGGEYTKPVLATISFMWSTKNQVHSHTNVKIIFLGGYFMQVITLSLSRRPVTLMWSTQYTQGRLRALYPCQRLTFKYKKSWGWILKKHVLPFYLMLFILVGTYRCRLKQSNSRLSSGSLLYLFPVHTQVVKIIS